MRERERLELRKFREEEAARERQEQEQRMRPVREVEAGLNETARQIYNTVRERLLTMRDDEFKIDPATTKPILTASVPEWQREQSAEFKAANPDYFPCTENEKTLVDYINRNAPDIKLVSALQLEQAFKRLTEYGLMRERPEPLPILESQPEPIAEPQPPATAYPEVFTGVDLATGLERQFTAWEVDRMTADTYRRVFQLIGDKRPRFIDPRK